MGRIVDAVRHALGANGGQRDERDTVRAEARAKATMAQRAAERSRRLRELMAADAQYRTRVRGKL